MKRWLLVCILLSAKLQPYAEVGIENRIAALSDSLVRQFPDSIPAPLLAVVPFTDNTGKNQGVSVAELVVSALQKKGRFILVDRGEFKTAVMEIELAQTDMVDTATALRLGKILSAPYLCTGTIADVFGQCRVQVKIIHTETTEIIATAAIAVAPASLDGLSKKLLGERTQVSAAVFRSAVAPGWGQFYTRQPVRGAISIAAFLGAGIYFIYSAQQSAEAKRVSKEYDEFRYTAQWWANIRADTAVTHESWPEAVSRFEDSSSIYYNEYSRKYDRTVIAGGITGAVWTLNLLDALIAGIQAKRSFRPYFSASAGGRYRAGIAVRF